MRCPHCSSTLAPHARHCPNCGRAVDDEAATIGADGPTRSGIKPPSGGWLSASDAISHGRFAPGAVLDGRYRIIGLLGRGGMGEVYRADDLRLGQPVALKFLPDAVAHDPIRLAQFHNEVRTARQISHANLCRVYDIGEVDGHLFLSMEYVDGEDLASLLRRIGRVAEDKALEIARQLCAGLAAAHERGVIHRDLKPANVMLDGAGKVRLMDFGLATAGAVDDVRTGTPAYMAPEQLLGKEVTARSDIYALGLVLYELFTGRRVFSAATLNDLIDQQQSGSMTPPSAYVSTLDPAIERAILRCLERDPAHRPSSPLAVAAALPGGDPLAAALAAGETPSPAMVAAAGEGVGLSRRVAIAVFVVVLAGLAAAYVMAAASNPLNLIRAEMSSDVLAHQARDAVRALGYTERPRDEAYGFGWDDALVSPGANGTGGRWRSRVVQRPGPLYFWYRRSQQPLTALTFHHDLLTPGIVTIDDPPPLIPGMMQLTLDHQGRLTSFETIPPQAEETPVNLAAVDWTRILTLAGLDPAALQVTPPQWHWLAGPDTRVAWAGIWPSDEGAAPAAAEAIPLRVEAASRHGQPVALHLIAPTTRHWRAPQTDDRGGAAIVTINLALVVSILIAGTVLTARHLREGRGDRRGAFRLAAAMTGALAVVWLCQTHATASIGMIASFLLMIVTTGFHGLLFWGLYLALEPFVRRHWPQTLVSWTTILSGRSRDSIVGRDALFGVALGLLIVLLIRSVVLYLDDAPVVGPAEVLQGTRTLIGYAIAQAIYAIRAALFFFFLIFLLRALVKRESIAALIFVVLFGLLDSLDSTRPLLEFVTTSLYFAMLAAAVLRWGLTSLVVALLSANLLLAMPASTDVSAWYFSSTLFLLAIPTLIAVWGLVTAIRAPRAAALRATS